MDARFELPVVAWEEREPVSRDGIESSLASYAFPRSRAAIFSNCSKARLQVVRDLRGEHMAEE
jgi:hypothetical protein